MNPSKLLLSAIIIISSLWGILFFQEKIAGLAMGYNSSEADFYARLVQIKEVLDQDTDSSRVFSFLQETRLPQISYLNWELSLPVHRLVIDGLASSESEFSRQLAVFRSHQWVRETSIIDSAKSKDGWVFIIAINFYPRTF